MTSKTYTEALREAHEELLREDDDVFVLGEDVRDSLVGTTDGLVDEFGEARVRDTPISEQGFVGVGVGAAAGGKRPIVELQVSTLAHVAMEQLVDHAVRFRYLSGEQYTLPLTLTVMTGAFGGQGGQHSDAPYPGLMHHGLKSVVPATPYDAKGLLRSAVREDDPVAVFLPALLRGRTGAVPDDPYEVPLGEAAVRRSGEDVTVLAIGEAVPSALEAAGGLDADVEVVDLRSLLPLDEETVFTSVEKTGRVVVVDPAYRTCGAAAEVAARIASERFGALRAPIKRVTRPDVPVSYSPREEHYVQTDRETIRRAVRDVR
jgi:pyruvate dehydrogenase E1 component beta subunit